MILAHADSNCNLSIVHVYRILGPFNLYLYLDALFIKAHQYDLQKRFISGQLKVQFYVDPRDHEEPPMASFNMMIVNINRLLRTGNSVGTNLQNLDGRRIFIGARGIIPVVNECNRALNHFDGTSMFD